MDYTEEPQSILSLCTGMRGLERGIERVTSIRTVAYVEIEAFICENLVQQMEQGILASAPVWTDLKTFPSEQFHGKIHGITGGYPCQPFSVAGKRGGEEDPRHLWPYIKKMVGAIRPVWCFFENVPGHLTLGYREVRSDLEQLGYTVEEGIFSAEEVGAPHQRKRLFILAVANANINQLWSGRLPFRKKKKVTDTSITSSYSEELGITNSQRLQRHRRECQLSESGIKGENIRTGSGMANTNSSGSRKDTECGNSGKSEEGQEKEKQNERWPAGPQFEQYEWEATRTESSVGFTINGHNFREDLLRMAGNGVVEQCAQLAFETLLKKHRL